MTLEISDRVVETATTTGTGDITLDGAITGYRSFGDALSVGDTCYYCIEDVDSNGIPTGDWEVGLGTYSAADTLTRTTVHKSSNANALVDFAAGTKRVMITVTEALLANKITAIDLNTTGWGSDGYCIPFPNSLGIGDISEVGAITMFFWNPGEAGTGGFELDMKDFAGGAAIGGELTANSRIPLLTYGAAGGFEFSDTPYVNDQKIFYEGNLLFGAGLVLDSATDTLSAAPIGGGGDGTVPDGVVSGCGVVYSGTGLTFALSAGTFYLNQVLYSASSSTVTLGAADATFDRIDALYVDITGMFGVVAGTPGADPEAPDVDAETQLLLVYITVPAAATDLTGTIDDVAIYSEGAEWTPTVIGTTIDAASANNPHAGTKCIEFTAAETGDYVRLVAGSPLSFDGDGNILLWVRSKAAWGSDHLNLFVFSGGSRKGARVALRSGSFGFNSSNTTSYQLVIIPKSLFAIDAGTLIDELRIKAVSGSGMGLYLDDIVLQTPASGVGGGTTSTGITQAAADARYLRQSRDLADVGDAAAARSNLDVLSSSEVDTAADARIALASINDLADVDTTSLSVGDTFTWNGTIWVPSTPASAGHSYGFEGFGSLNSIAALTKLSGASGNITLTDGSPSSLYSWTSSGANQLQLADDVAVSTPFDYYLRMMPRIPFAVNVQFGLILRNSTSGKIISFGYNNDNALNVQEWSSPTSFSSTILSKTFPSFFLRPLWLRVHSDGTTLTFYYGGDGINWVQHSTRTIATFLGSINRAGIGGVPQTAAEVLIGNFGTTAPSI